MASSRNRKVVLLTLYIVVMIYAFFLAPGSLTDISQVLKVVSGPAAESNPLFRSLFSLLLPVGIGMFAVLSAGAPSQSELLPVELFGILGSFLGFYGVGLYIALRERAPNTGKGALARASWLVRAMESRFIALFVLGYSLKSYAALFPLEGDGAKGLSACLTAFWQLVQSDRYVWASTLDIFILFFVGYDPLSEDMQRRGWTFRGPGSQRSRMQAVSILVLPGVGIGTYLLFRPKVVGRDANSTE